MELGLFQDHLSQKSFLYIGPLAPRDSNVGICSVNDSLLVSKKSAQKILCLASDSEVQ